MITNSKKQNIYKKGTGNIKMYISFWHTWILAFASSAYFTLQLTFESASSSKQM